MSADEAVIDLCSDSGSSSDASASDADGAGEPSRGDDDVISISSGSEASRGVPSVITTRRESSDESDANGVRYVSGSRESASAESNNYDVSSKAASLLDRPVFSGRQSIAKGKAAEEGNDAPAAGKSSDATGGSPDAQLEEELLCLVERSIAERSATTTRRNRRRSDGYDLGEGERMVMATEIEGGHPHQAIILHPQPDPPSLGLVRIEWFNSNAIAWIPKTQIWGDVTEGSDKESGDAAKNPKRRKRANMGCIKRFSEEEFAEPSAKRREKTCTNVEQLEAPKDEREGKAPPPANEEKISPKRRGKTCFSVEQASRKRRVADDDDVSGLSAATLGGERSEIELITAPPSEISLSAYSDGDGVRSVLTAVTNTAGVVTPQSQQECHLCQSNRLHRREIDSLLAKFRDLPLNEGGEKLMNVISSFQVLIQGMEDDCFDGTGSLLFHSCKSNDHPNPILTIAKLVQLFGCVCWCTPTLLDLDEANGNDTNGKLLFDQCKKKNLSCGIVLQVFRLATFELVNSRQGFASPESPADLDRLMGVTFGLQLLQSMARNVYEDAKTHFDCSFLGGQLSLESNTKCIKRNCHKRGPFIRCNKCGLQIHKKCVSGNSANLADECPTCNASSMLMDAARVGDLADIYSLVVEKGASPLQTYLCEATCSNGTALHTAVRRNEYDLASMLLYGAHVLLRCDDELAKWNIPDIAWGRDSELRTPFRFGSDLIKGNLFVRPPVETLMLLCGRGAKGTRDDILKALQIRQNMKLVNAGLELNQNNLQKELQSDIATGLEPTKIPVVFTSESSPVSISSFMYVARNVESRSTAIRWFDCRIEKKLLTPFTGGCTVDSLKLLHQQQCMPSSWRACCNYLCESRRGPMKPCECQLAEKGLHHNLEVFATPDRGLGVRTAKGSFIAKNSILCHYSGELITSGEAAARDKAYARTHAGSCYIIDADEKGKYCIDATQTRSVAALINHACSEANCELFRSLSNHLDCNFPFIGLRAKEDIPGGTELTFNYGQKPTGLCSDCGQHHCLCPQCKVLAHEKL